LLFVLRECGAVEWIVLGSHVILNVYL